MTRLGDNDSEYQNRPFVYRFPGFTSSVPGCDINAVDFYNTNTYLPADEFTGDSSVALAQPSDKNQTDFTLQRANPYSKLLYVELKDKYDIKGHT